MEGAVAFLPGGFFHVYNHANGDENLFRTPDNYAYSLRKYGEYLGPVVDTFAYCLMPNHFHLMVRVKPEWELSAFAVEKKRKQQETGAGLRKNLQGLQDLEGLVSQQFSNFFNAYVKAFNKQQNRRGNLLMHNLRRKPIPDEQYFTQLIAYIHQNPAHHGFTPDFRTWPHSSYRALLSESPTRLCRAEVLDWFGNRAEFVRAHAAVSS
jgi:putative transposase